MNIKSLLLILAGCFPVSLFAADFECISSVCRQEIANGKLYTTDSLIYQVNDRAGEQYSEFVIYYSKIDKISKVNAWIEDIKGNRIRDLKKTEFQDRSWAQGYSLYEDSRIKLFQIKHNKYPYRVCYTYTRIASQFNTIVDWQPLDNDMYPIREAKLYVTLPLKYPVRSYVHNMSTIKTDTLTDKIVTRYLVKGSPVMPIKSDERIFDFDRPRVCITPLNFHYGIDGSNESWGSFGNWYAKLNRGLTSLPGTEQLKISQMLEGITDTVDVIKSLYQYLQDNTRYVNVTIGIGGFKSYPASYVAQNKYGDCKALSNYMKALLEFKGIKSYFVLIQSGDRPVNFIEEFSCSQFDHVFLAVPVDRDTVWLENTSGIIPFNYVGTFIQNRKALLVDDVHSHLISVPSLKKKDVVCVRKMNIGLDETGNADFSAVFSNRGPSYRHLNDFKNYGSDKDKNDVIEDYIPFKNYELIDWKFGETNRDSAKIDLKLKLNVPKLARVIGNDCYIKTVPVSMGSVKISDPVNMPASILWPVYNIDSSVYTIPTGYKLKKLPGSVSFFNNFGNYICTFTVKEDKIYVYKKLEISQVEYSALDYGRLYAFLKTIKESENSTMISLTNTQE